jgi:hypothetical protein
MDVRDTLTALLPPPRDDEPASLRQDIIDELSDHLACAYNQELLRGVDSSVARQRVRERFGDPAALARRLWFDAMKGKIMAQRFLIATCLVVILACLSLVGLVYIQSSRAAVQTAEANRKLSEALAQAQSANKVMLSKLSEMAEAIRNPRSADWNPVKFTLTEDTLDGPPAAGCSISVGVTDDGKWIVRTSDASGVADFGLLHPGSYTFQVSKSWDRGALLGSGDFHIEPGSQVDKRIVCPQKTLKPVPLDVRFSWPADLEKEGLVLDAPFWFGPIEKEGTSWSLNPGTGLATHFVLFGPGAAVTEIRNPGGLYFWATSPQTPFADVLTSDLRTINEPEELLRWERGTYQLPELVVLRPSDQGSVSAGRRRFKVLVRCYPQLVDDMGADQFREEPPTEKELRSGGGNFGFSGSVIGSLGLSVESWSKIATRFEARPDRVNEWTITLPEELIKVVREAVKTDKTPKPQ